MEITARPIFLSNSLWVLLIKSVSAQEFGIAKRRRSLLLIRRSFKGCRKTKREREWERARTRDTQEEWGRKREERDTGTMLCVKVLLTRTLPTTWKLGEQLILCWLSPHLRRRGSRERKGGYGKRKMASKALDARLLPAEEPSVRSPVPVQPQRQALIPPPVRARRTPAVVPAAHLEAPWLCRNSRMHARVYAWPIVLVLLPCTSRRRCQSVAGALNTPHPSNVP